MKPELKRLMQIGIIVRSVEESVKFYEEMGIGPWDISCIDNTKPPFDDLIFDGKEVAEKGVIIRTAMMQRYGLEIELVEPVAKDTPYMKWLEEKGPGMHHMAFDLESGYENFLAESKRKTGREPWIRGQAIQGKMDFSYVDMREEMGMIIECYKLLQPGKPVLDFDHNGGRAE